MRGAFLYAGPWTVNSHYCGAGSYMREAGTVYDRVCSDLKKCCRLEITAGHYLLVWGKANGMKRQQPGARRLLPASIAKQGYATSYRNDQNGRGAQEASLVDTEDDDDDSCKQANRQCVRGPPDLPEWCHYDAMKAPAIL
ncbi:hypothetical protein VOLCADRAFT_93173 [Volvox carteri f. nagariensis]|uniref:Uncharacterized protein n=1 Tax=Volvox carteri f. nagariensis TaxID=3068 RepID=D8U1H4_VOLCA|nr:uncharacterized protein VOLCADRAFT_93173 [Volvox carteri f. nagariensis]EFJ46343.1 hypothetical protein VOLCADRAFT_93173 [Volvox carteri f. nagariensis]|eukprot:XP_002952496.1 hypothetical protein VOLCADRAFT_93173 [Volvox carteri f. nagariensis]